MATVHSNPNRHVVVGGWYFVASCLAAALGGLLFGFDTAVISGAERLLIKQFEPGDWMQGWIVSSALVGCLIGAGAAGPLSDRFGRKLVLVLSALLFAATSVGCALAPDLLVLTLARLVGGVGVGVAGMVAPLYIAEISPPHLRGRMIAVFQLAITIGIVAAYLSNAALRHLATVAAPESGGAWYQWLVVREVWRAMLGSLLLPAAAFFLLALGVPESPRWLVKQGRHDEARRILARIVGARRAADEIAEIGDAVAHEQGDWRQLQAPGVRKALAMAVFLAVAGQLSGINAIIYYGPRIFESAHYELGAALSGQVILGLVNVVFTLLAMWKVDTLGRRPLLLAGNTGVAAALALLAVCFAVGWTENLAVISLMCAFLACFAFSLGPLPWIFMAEVFPTRIRGRAMGLATLALWAANFVVCQTFPTIDKHWGPAAAFALYAALVLPVFYFGWRIMPETKGHSLEELERYFASNSSMKG